VFRLHRSRVYYVRESLMRQAISVPRASLISLGVCLGKFSKTDKFRLHVTGLDLLGRYAKNKVRSLGWFSQRSGVGFARRGG
jgi:60S ribosome subunit biogenesis protein NIP7